MSHISLSFYLTGKESTSTPIRNFFRFSKCLPTGSNPVGRKTSFLQEVFPEQLEISLLKPHRQPVIQPIRTEGLT